MNTINEQNNNKAIVDFAQLSEEDKQKYIDFILNNNI